MMSSLGIAIFVISVVVGCLQAMMSLKFVSALKREPPPPLPDSDCPHVLAVLCLRGTDPFLPRSLRRLFEQDYPNYTVRVVIDTPDDPVRPLVEDTIRQTGVHHVEVVVLDRHDENCSAKMSSLLQATEDLPHDCRIVATFDGDAILHASCLRELVTPLVAGSAEITTGYRWFAPDPLTAGAMGRFQWNLGSAPLMHQMDLMWGGCLAMTRRVIQDAELRDLYAHAFAEDMLLASFMRKRNETIQFVPQAILVNHEDLSLGGLFSFLTRQMLCVRLHHHQWKRIVGYGMLLSSLTTIVCPIGLLFPQTREWCVASLVFLIGTVLVAMALQGRAVRRVLARRDERLIAFTPRVVWAMLYTAPLTQLMMLVSNMRAIFARRITWRGLTYELRRDSIVRLVQETSVADLGHEYTSIDEKALVEALSVPATAAKESVAS